MSKKTGILIGETRQERLNRLRKEITEQWALACKHEGLSSDSKFVVFSELNPHIPKHDELLRGLQDLLKGD